MATLAAPQYDQTTSIDHTEAQRLTTDNIVPSYGIQIKALAANTGKVYVGYDNDVVTTTGYELSAGQEVFISLAEVQDAYNVWIIASAASQGVCWRVV